MMGFSVILDTCVLYPSYLRDTLLRLATAETYRPLWSQHIIDELSRNLEQRLEPGKTEVLVNAMTTHFGDAMVSGYDPLIPAMTNDPKDRHVLAAAVRANASGIVTFNLSDFPSESVKPLEIDVLHPDEFLLNQWELSPALAMGAMTDQVAGYQRPAMSLGDLGEALRVCGCPDFGDVIIAAS